jgi:hypothetical protein
MPSKQPAGKLEQRRRLAVRRVGKGWTHKAVARFLGVSEQAVGSWVAAHRARGDNGLEVKARPGAAPRLIGLYTAVAILYHALPQSKCCGARYWPGKQGSTISDTLAAVRRWLWSEWVFPHVQGGAAVEKLPDPIREIIFSTLAPAA